MRFLHLLIWQLTIIAVIVTCYCHQIHAQVGTTTRDPEAFDVDDNKLLPLSARVRRSLDFTPCSFPTPSTPEFSRCSSYLGLAYICDPSGLLSRTEAEQLDAVLRQNFSHCFCSNSCSDGNAALSIGVAIIETAIVDCMQLQRENCINNGGVCSAEDFFMASPYSSGEYYTRIGQLYADTVRSQWHTESCSTAILLIFIKTWKWKSEFCQVLSNRLFLSMSQEARDLLLVHRRSTLWRLLFHGQAKGDAYSLFHSLKQAAMVLSEPVEMSTVEGIPLWALVLIVSCSVFTVLLAAAGHCISSRQHQRLFRSSRSHAGVGSRKWQAGFAGGMWEAPLLKD